jgi:hypothetical protein
MDTINKSTQPGGLRMPLKVRKRVSNEVTAFFSDSLINGF